MAGDTQDNDPGYVPDGQLVFLAVSDKQPLRLPAMPGDGFFPPRVGFKYTGVMPEGVDYCNIGHISGLSRQVSGWFEAHPPCPSPKWLWLHPWSWIRNLRKFRRRGYKYISLD